MSVPRGLEYQAVVPFNMYYYIVYSASSLQKSGNAWPLEFGSGIS